MFEKYYVKGTTAPKKRKKATITRAQINDAMDDFLKRGGEIQVIKTEDSYYSSHPVGTDIFSKSKGSILDALLGG